MKFISKLAITSDTLQQLIIPITDLIDAAIPGLLALVTSIGLVWCIVLGVKYAKAEDPQEHEKAKNALKNAIIGFILIFVLLIMVKIGYNVFYQYWRGYNTNIGV